MRNKQFVFSSLAVVSLGLAQGLAAKSDLDQRFFKDYSKAVKAEKQGSTLQAVKLYQAANTIKHRDINTLLKLGLLHLNSDAEGDVRTQSLNLAVDHFSKAVAIRPDDTMANLLLGKSYEELGDLENATKYLIKASNIEPDNVLLKANLGRLYFEQKDFKKAIEIFNKVILAYPDNLKARGYLGAALQSTDNYLAAIEQYNYILNYNPDEYSIVKNLADSWLALKQYPKAKESYQKAQKLDPKVPDIYADIAFVARQEEDYTTAISNYRKALELKENAKWQRALAYSLWSNNKLEEAIVVFDQITEHKISAYLYQSLGNNDQAILSYQKAIEKDPKDYKSRFNLARIYHDRNDLASARAEYEKLLEQKPNDVETLFLIATLRQEQGDLDIAMDYYNELLDKHLITESEDDNKLIKNNVHYNLGLAYKNKQNLEKAEENFEALIGDDVKDPAFTKTKDVYKELSFIKIALDKDTEAETIINSWLREDPTSVEARNLYADFLVHLARDRRAIEQLRLASVLDKTTTTRLKLANLLHSQNNLYEALAEYQTILQQDPANLNALLGAANNFKSLGFKEEAVNMYKQTLEEYPEDVLANFNYGLLMQEANKLELAKTHYEKVLEISPNFLQTYYVLGLVYWDLGEKEKAQNLWDTFMASSTDNKLKQEIEKLLKKPELKPEEKTDSPEAETQAIQQELSSNGTVEGLDII